MAIKIIKDGKKEFYITCPSCGCEFIYGLNDLKRGTVYSTIKCPCCGDEIVHSNTGKEFAQGIFVSPKSNINDATTDPSIKDNMVWETPEYKKLLENIKQQPSYIDCNKSVSPCETCSYYQRLRGGEVYVGDSPCQWCQKNPYKVTCTAKLEKDK